MLKQILSDMYIDPQLLAELNEEQKQILFFKMRQEQIRRCEKREAAAEEISAKKPLPRKGKSLPSGYFTLWHISKLGADNEVWVWVMGEHPSDKSYAAICEEIQAQRAKRLVREQVLLQELQQSPESAKDEDDNDITQEHLTGEGEYQSPDKQARLLTKFVLDKISLAAEKAFHQLPTTEVTGSYVNIKQFPSESFLQFLDLWKSKAADEKRRSLAQQARDDYRRLSLQGIHRGKHVDISKGATVEDRQPLQYPPLPPKPKLPPPTTGVQRTISNSTEESIIKWFKEDQFPLRTGYLKTTDTIHLVLYKCFSPFSFKAEELLNKTVPGSFLIQVSEKIQGYVLSYQSVEGCKHFLIDASSDSYSFLGVDQLQHAMLADLVNYHKDEPITSLGKELLLYPCGQEDQEPDYISLFE
uniref:SH2 domain containing 4A n=1 Tax=Catharus ustulatus TaxID=91951 RepID=A0A8C3TNK7_CATUS